MWMDFTKYGMFIDIVEIWFRIASGQISSIFDIYLPATHPYFCFSTITWVNITGIHQTWYLHWYCQDVVLNCYWANFINLWQLFAHYTIMAGYYCFTFLFVYTLFSLCRIHVKMEYFNNLHRLPLDMCWADDKQLQQSFKVGLMETNIFRQTGILKFSSDYRLTHIQQKTKLFEK